MSAPVRLASLLGVLALAGACSPEPPAPWPSRCNEGVETGAPTQLAWTVVGPWNSRPIYRALPDGAVVAVGPVLPPEDETGPALESWIEIHVYEPDGSLRWTDRYHGYVGYETRILGLAVDAAGNVLVSGLDIYAKVISDPIGGDRRELGDQLLLSWTADGERRFRSRTETCGIEAARGLGIVDDGSFLVANWLGEDTQSACTIAFAPTGESRGATSIPLVELWSFLWVQWDGSVLSAGDSTEAYGQVLLSRYAPDGELLWSRVDEIEGYARYSLTPGLVGDGRTVVTYTTEVGPDDMPEIRSFVDDGELDWRTPGSALGVNCAGEVIAELQLGSEAMLDPDSGEVVTNFDPPIPRDGRGELVPSPDGAVYVSRFAADGVSLARLEPK